MPPTIMPTAPAPPKAAAAAPISSAAQIAKAERVFAEAKVLAEGAKQVAVAKAMKMPMPSHLAAIRAGERDYHLSLARAADASSGIISSAPYHQAAAV